MASESTKATILVVTAALGLGLVALPWLPQERPNPLEPTFALASPSGRELRSALAWHDEACATGDLAEFRRRVTDAYARDLARRLRQLGRALDAAALREYVGADRARGLAVLTDDCLGGWSHGDRGCLIVGARDGRTGVQGIAFVWDGARFRLDRLEHQPGIARGDAAAVAAFARRLVDTP